MENNIIFKTRIIDIINEIDNLKKYNNNLASSSSGEKIENYLDKLNKDIVKAQNKIETIYSNNYK